MRNQEQHVAMMKRLSAALPPDEYYLVCVALACLQTRFATDEVYCKQAYGTMGTELFERLLEE